VWPRLGDLLQRRSFEKKENYRRGIVFVSRFVADEYIEHKSPSFFPKYTL